MATGYTRTEGDEINRPAVGFVLLAFLTAFACLDAVGIALRAAPAGRAELGVVSILSFFTLLGAPIFLLGYTSTLTPRNLAGVSLFLFTIVLVVLARRRGLRAHLRECRDAALSLAKLPFDAIAEAWRARSFVAFGLFVTFGILAAATVLTFFVPFQSWDGFFYHEPIVGYAIQNHGFESVSLPSVFTVQSTNGYPRLCESLSLWFCIFTDRSLIEIVPELAMPALLLCVFALARRFTDRVAAMGWSMVLFFVPHVWHGLCSTYLDIDVALFALTAMYYASRPAYRVRDCVIASLGLALVVASKGSGLLWAPPIALIAYGRLIVRFIRARTLATLATIAGTFSGVTFVASLTLVKNWREYGNPLWPFKYKIPFLHIDWPGLTTTQEMLPTQPWGELLKQTTNPPAGGMTDIMQRGYGTGFVWVVLPLGIVAMIAATIALARELVRLRWRAPITNLWMVLFPALVSLKTTLSIVEQPRYNIHIMAATIVACAWLLRRRAWLRVREGVIGGAIALSLLQFFWLRDANLAPPEEIAEHLADPFAPRAYSHTPSIDLLGPERYAEIHAGDRVVCDEHLEFVGDLWNFDFSNRVEFVPYTSDDDYVARIDKVDPKWVCVGNGSPSRSALEKTGKWSFVGRLSAPYDNVVLRRSKR
jgi:hypothetical protein